MKRIIMPIMGILLAFSLFASSAYAAVYGDADADNVLSASDASYVLQKVLISTFELPIEKETDDWLKYVDVSDDGVIAADDAAFILQKVLISTYLMPCEKDDLQGQKNNVPMIHSITVCRCRSLVLEHRYRDLRAIQAKADVRF